MRLHRGGESRQRQYRGNQHKRHEAGHGGKPVLTQGSERRVHHHLAAVGNQQDRNQPHAARQHQRDGRVGGECARQSMATAPGVGFCSASRKLLEAMNSRWKGIDKAMTRAIRAAAWAS